MNMYTSTDRYENSVLHDLTQTNRTSTLPSSMYNPHITSSRIHLANQVRHRESLHNDAVAVSKWQYNLDQVSSPNTYYNRGRGNLCMYRSEDHPSVSADLAVRVRPHILSEPSAIINEDENNGTDTESGVDVVRDRLLSIWNNMKYGWNAKLQTSFSNSWPIYILGTTYNPNQLIDTRMRVKLTEVHCQELRERTLDLFKQDYYSRIWFTYRRQFPKLQGSQFTTDCGWGCMLRTGSMMMAQAFSSHFLGRDWRWLGTHSDKSDMIHRMIIKWFLDDPEAPFSIHQLVKVGYAIGKRPGDWYGPATVAHVMTQALAEAFLENPILENIACYVAQDCTIYIQDVIKLCTEATSSRRRTSLVKKEARERASSLASAAGPAGHRVEVDLARITMEADALSSATSEDDDVFDTLTGKQLTGDRLPKSRSSLLNNKAISTFNLYTDTTMTSAATSGYSSIASKATTNTLNSEAACESKNSRWRGIVLYIPLRLGGEKFNPVYAESVKSLLKHPLTLGIIGGRPKHSLYFIGVQDDKLIYLDPHLCQDSVNVNQVDFSLDSFHCRYARKMPITKMDPSCTVAFYCRTRDDLNNLIESAKSFTVPGLRHTDYPIFVFSNGSSYSAGKSEQDSRTVNDNWPCTRLTSQYSSSSYSGSHSHLDMCDDFVIIS